MSDTTSGSAPLARSRAREKTIAMRCSPEQKKALLKQAADEGLTLQLWLERRLLDPNAQPRQPGRPLHSVAHGQEAFDLTG